MRNARIAAVLVVVAALVLSYRLGILQQFADPVRAKQTLVELGPWGYAAFLGAYTVLQPFGVPGTVFVMAAPLIWPWYIAFVLSMAGTMTASVVGFSFARFVARDWVAATIPARFHRYDEALARRAFTTVALMRFIFWMPQWLHSFFGVSKVSFATHFWGSLAGYAIPLFVVSLYGQRLFDVLKGVPASAWIGMGAGIAVVALGWWGWRVRRVPSRAGGLKQG